MARIAGVDLPKNKRGEIGLTYIFGIGPSTAKYILDKNNISRDKKVHEWNDDDLNAIRNTLRMSSKLKVNCVQKYRQVSSVCWISPATVVFAIVKACRFVVSVPKPIAVQEKVSVRQLRVRRKPLRNNNMLMVTDHQFYYI